MRLFKPLQEVKMAVTEEVYRSSEADFISASKWIVEKVPTASFSMVIRTDDAEYLHRWWPRNREQGVEHELVGLYREYQSGFPIDYLGTSRVVVDRFMVRHMTVYEIECSNELPWKLLRMDSVLLRAPKQFVHILETYAKKLQKIEITGDCYFGGFWRKEEFVEFVRRRLPNVTVTLSPVPDLF